MPGMTPPGLALGGAAAVAALLSLVTPVVLRRLPEPPPDDPDALHKLPYQELATPRVAAACAGCGAAAALVTFACLPGRVQPLWLVLATVGVLGAVVDAVTTWLPNRLVYSAWLLMAAAALGSLGGADGAALLRTAAGAAVAWLLYLVVWLASRGGFGFADVRFAPLVGAATCAVSWTLLLWGLVLGTLVGGVVGLVRLASRLRGEFAYVPSMLTGAYVAAILGYLTSTGV